MVQFSRAVNEKVRRKEGAEGVASDVRRGKSVVRRNDESAS
jgi:hypothetical protein